MTNIEYFSTFKAADIVGINRKLVGVWIDRGYLGKVKKKHLSNRRSIYQLDYLNLIQLLFLKILGDFSVQLIYLESQKLSKDRKLLENILDNSDTYYTMFFPEGFPFYTGKDFKYIEEHIKIGKVALVVNWKKLKEEIDLKLGLIDEKE